MTSTTAPAGRRILLLHLTLVNAFLSTTGLLNLGLTSVCFGEAPAAPDSASWDYTWEEYYDGPPPCMYDLNTRADCAQY